MVSVGRGCSTLVLLDPEVQMASRSIRWMASGLDIFTMSGGGSAKWRVIVSFHGTPLVLMVDIHSEGSFISSEAVAGEVCHAIETQLCPCSAEYIEKLVLECLLGK